MIEMAASATLFVSRTVVTIFFVLALVAFRLL
jgi:hypothetical protein